MILENSLFGIDLYGIGLAMIWLAVVLAVVSAVQYTIGFWKKI
jgi:CDP-diacylglycerol--glycerol-3-phosphate 3-phosphatidyltransferase